MAQSFEADIALIHIAGGAARLTSPPGTLALTAPRRTARGRGDDFLLLNLSLQSSRPVSPGYLDHIVRMAADAYYGTPGSVTSALREAAALVNDQLMDANQDEAEPTNYQGNLMSAVLRGKDLYFGQSGVGQVILVRPGAVTRLSSEEASERPLGISLAPHIRFYHFESQPNDLLVLTTTPSDLWSDATLSGLATLDLEQAIDRLVAASSYDLTGLLARIVLPGRAGLQPSFESTTPSAESSPQMERTAQERFGTVTRGVRRFQWGNYIAPLTQGLKSITSRTLTVLSRTLNRLAPGFSEPLHPDALSRQMLVGTAIAIPLIIVTIASLVYVRKGRREEFESYVDQARTSVMTAQTLPPDETSRGEWEFAAKMLTLADSYGTSTEAQALLEQVQVALDTINLVSRLEFRPLVSGGFGSDAVITGLAASATDLYVLDGKHEIIRHAWGAPERGYEMDTAFECLGTAAISQELAAPIDFVLQPAPGALGMEGVVAIDDDGTLLYCAPDRQPAIAQLTPPDIGWGRLQAIDVYGDNLYVLDPVMNAVWIYEAAGGFFSGVPKMFFVEEVRDLKGAIDLAMAHDELIILYADGRLDRCRRTITGAEADGARIRVECVAQPYFQDERAGREPTAQIPGAVPVELDYSPPPEPSLYFLDLLSNSVFHYSLRLVYQGQFMPKELFEEEISAMTIGPPNDLYLAVGSQVYQTRLH
ncbi:MAG: hypothetical protein KAR65_01590 [Anaerolineales bacterium]|nr:hypothetical protein [Anaerolineales bacterium]